MQVNLAVDGKAPAETYGARCDNSYSSTKAIDDVHVYRATV